MGYIANAMLFFVGWHYVKQGYGILMTLSARKKVYYNKWEKLILLGNAYVIWLAVWFTGNGQAADFKGVYFKSLKFPDFVGEIMAVSCGISTILVLLVFLKKIDIQKQYSINGMTAYICALYPWTLIANINPVLFVCIPAFHSLQYLLFVWKVQYERYKEQEQNARGDNTDKDILKKMTSRKLNQFALSGVVFGMLYFVLLPGALDYFVAYDKELFGPTIFIFMFFIFINIHHYFIDFAIWRKENPDMEYLFR